VRALRLAREVRERLTKELGQPVKVIMFGSQARGDPETDSLRTHPFQRIHLPRRNDLPDPLSRIQNRRVTHLFCRPQIWQIQNVVQDPNRSRAAHLAGAVELPRPQEGWHIR